MFTTLIVAPSATAFWITASSAESRPVVVLGMV